jgi:hypothetical protein
LSRWQRRLRMSLSTWQQFRATRDRLRDMAAEITVIHRRVERLEEQGGSNARFAKEIDTTLLTRVAEIKKPLGIDKKTAARRGATTV